ncbi:signal peptidase I [Candidatus Bathyarchaeota archaeon]|nr:signal peptidase I [Candidatus Bathyarchaeota archaeon]
MRHVKLRYAVILSLIVGVLFMNYVMPMIPVMRSLGARMMIVASGSMKPFLNLGDIVVLTGTDPENIKEGDVITFNVAQRPQQQYNYPPTVTHRVVEIVKLGSEIYFQTKGDTTEKDPFTVPARDVIGVYAWKIPYAGLPFAFLRSTYGLMLLTSYIIMDTTFTYGPTLWEKRQEKEKAMTMMLQDVTGIKQSLENLSISIMRNIVGSDAGILLKRKSHGKVEVVEKVRPEIVTVKRHLVEKGGSYHDY